MPECLLPYMLFKGEKMEKEGRFWLFSCHFLLGMVSKFILCHSILIQNQVGQVPVHLAYLFMPLKCHPNQAYLYLYDYP